jgi:sirohydrochlorin ferrochelatase
MAGGGPVKALVVVAHGSRRESSNDEVRALATRMHTRSGMKYDLVNCGFLELAEPSIPGGVQQAIDAGATQVHIYPYFLSAGRHVVEDIPAEIEIARVANPDVAIEILDYLGAAEGLADFIFSQIGNRRLR